MTTLVKNMQFIIISLVWAQIHFKVLQLRYESTTSELASHKSSGGHCVPSQIHNRSLSGLMPHLTRFNLTGTTTVCKRLRDRRNYHSSVITYDDLPQWENIWWLNTTASLESLSTFKSACSLRFVVIIKAMFVITGLFESFDILSSSLRSSG